MCWLRCIWDVTFPRRRRTTLIVMTALALISALGTALCVGYYLGRPAGSKPSTWKKRTSRVALGRLAINLLVLMTARRIRQSLQAGRVFSDAARRSPSDPTPSSWASANWAATLPGRASARVELSAGP